MVNQQIWRQRSLRWLCIVGISASSWGAPAIALAQETLIRTLVVTGRASEDIQATITEIQLGIEAQGATPQAAQADVNGRSQALVKVLRDRRVRKLITTNVSLRPIYRNDKGEQTLKGYIASMSVQFQTPAAQAGAIVSAAVEAGATQINNVSFVADDRAIAAGRQIALTKATEDANAQAQAVLRALRISPQEVTSIRIDGAYAPPPTPIRIDQNSLFTGQDSLRTRLESRTDQLEAQAFSTTTNLAGTAIFALTEGTQTVNANVTLQIRY